MIKTKGRRGQVTIFIIAGIIIVAIVVLFFMLRPEKTPDIGDKPEKSPESFLDICLKDSLREAVDLIGSQGGYENPVYYRTFKFSNEEDYIGIGYLCYVSNYYEPCVTQEPMLFNHLKEEIGKAIKDYVWDCWDELGKSLEKQGYVVDARRRGFEIELRNNQVEVIINGVMTLTKAGESATEEIFKVKIPSKFYGLSKIVQEIVSQEATYCSFNNLGYMLLYPEWKIETFITGDGSKIYTIKHKKTQERFRFVIRTCVIPLGF